MPESKNVFDIAPQTDISAAELSDERFDRGAFALRVLDLICPQQTTVAVCEGATHLRLERGRRWGHEGHTWAMLAIPRQASKRAIVLALAELAGAPAAWTLDVLLQWVSEPEG